MDEQDTLNGRITRLATENPHLEDGKIADDVLASYPTRKALIDVLGPLVSNEVRRVRRAGARAAETAVFDGIVTEPGSGDPGSELTDDLVLGGFVVPGDPPMRVSWAEATVEHHELRIGALMTQVKGLRRTVSRHERAVALCHEHGVGSLGEIDGWESLLRDAPDASAA